MSKDLLSFTLVRLVRETLILTDEDVKKLLDMREVMEVVERAFKEKGLGRVQMPKKSYIFYDKYEGDLRVMPSYLEVLDVSAVKVVNSHPRNRIKYGLPTVMAVVVLVDPKSGFPMAIMSGSWLTAMRTGAAGGVAAKYLAREESETLCFIGAGTQARTQLMALSLVLKAIKHVKVYDVDEGASRGFADFSSKVVEGSKVEVCETPRKAVEEADVVTTATPSREPIVMNDWVKRGTHINCIGADAPGKEEIDPRILLRAKVVVDDVEQAVHGGEINVPIAKGLFRREQIYGELGEIIAGLKKGRERADEITVFTSTGLAIQDAVTANLAYDKAVARGLGMRIRLVV
jgi:alanine dehydrogenase